MELAKTTSEQRAEIYEDVRELLSPGFLAHSFSIGEAHFAMRSFDREDWDLLKYRTFGLNDRQWEAWCVASSIWMVNGTVIGSDENALYDLAQSFLMLPPFVLSTLYSIFNGLMKRVMEASCRSEAFLYEAESRILWKTLGPSIMAQVPVRPAQRFRNPVLSLWAYFNQMEDLRESEEREWAYAKFMASPHAPKGVKKINAQDRKRQNDTDRRRERACDRVFYEAKGLIARKGEAEKAGKNRPFQQVVMAETEDELRESMRRWVAGEKDDHDRTVDNIKARIKYGVEKRKEDVLKRRQALDAALSEEGFSRNQLTPLGGEAGKKFLERMHARIPGAKTVIADNTHNSAYTKYIENNPEVGDLHVDEEGNIQSLRPVTEEMLDVLRKPTDTPTLQQQIENRRPTATFVDDEGEES